MRARVLALVVFGAMVAATFRDPEAAAGALVFVLLTLMFAIPAVIIVGSLVDFFAGERSRGLREIR